MNPIVAVVLCIGWATFMAGIAGGMAQAGGYSTGAYFMVAGVAIMGSAIVFTMVE